MIDLEKEWAKMWAYIKGDPDLRSPMPINDDLKEVKLGPLKENPTELPEDLLHLHEAVFCEGVEVNDAPAKLYGESGSDDVVYAHILRKQDYAIEDGKHPNDRVEEYLRNSVSEDSK